MTHPHPPCYTHCSTPPRGWSEAKWRVCHFGANRPSATTIRIPTTNDNPAVPIQPKQRMMVATRIFQKRMTISLGTRKRMCLLFILFVSYILIITSFGLYDMFHRSFIAFCFGIDHCDQRQAFLLTNSRSSPQWYSICLRNIATALFEVGP